MEKGYYFAGVNNWKDFQDKLDEYTKTAANGGVKNEIQVTSWRKFKKSLKSKIMIKNDIFSKSNT